MRQYVTSLAIWLTWTFAASAQTPGAPTAPPSAPLTGHAIYQLLAPWIGPAIIAAVVALVGQFLLSRRQDRRDRIRRDELAFADAVSPVVEAADEIIARLFDIVKRQKSFDFGAFQFPTVLSDDLIRDPPPVLTTLYRFANYFACSSYLQRRVPQYSDVTAVRAADLFVANKTRMALKGNVSKSASRIPTETQQFIGSKFLSMSPDEKPDNLDFYRFMKGTVADDEARWCVGALARFLSFDPDFTKVTAEQVAVSMVLIYMIDMYQDLTGRAKWEEFRIFLVSVVRAWNAAHGGREIYLYGPRDLSATDYRSTFPLLHTEKESVTMRCRRITKRQARRRTLTANGVTTTRGNVTQKFDFTQSPGDLLAALKSLS